MRLEPIKSMAHIMVVTNDEASGSTIGYHGTVIRVIDRSVLAKPECPTEWSYRVYIPVLRAEFEIAASKIIPTNEVDDFDTSEYISRTIQFDLTSGEDIHGAYRVSDFEWIHFHFTRHDEPFDKYTLNMPMNTDLPNTRRLNYRVRFDAVLDRKYVCQTVQAILGRSSGTNNEAI